MGASLLGLPTGLLAVPPWHLSPCAVPFLHFLQPLRARSELCNRIYTQSTFCVVPVIIFFSRCYISHLTARHAVRCELLSKTCIVTHSYSVFMSAVRAHSWMCVNIAKSAARLISFSLSASSFISFSAFYLSIAPFTSLFYLPEFSPDLFVCVSLFASIYIYVSDMFLCLLSHWLCLYNCFSLSLSFSLVSQNLAESVCQSQPKIETGVWNHNG